MRAVRHRQAARYLAAGLSLAVTGALIVTFVSGGGRGTADAATNLAQYVRIDQVTPNVVTPSTGPDGSTGRFRVDCGTNANRKFSPDNPVAQPGIKNGAEHVHDFVGNLAITADSSNADLDASGTTCRNGDKSAYFWPVVRIDRSVRPDAGTVASAMAATEPELVCPRIDKRLPAVPQRAEDAVRAALAGLTRWQAIVAQQLAALRGKADPARINAVLSTAGRHRAAVLRTVGDAITAAGGTWPADMLSLADCDVSYDGIHAQLGHQHGMGNPVAPTRSVVCPTVRDRLPGIPGSSVAEVNRELVRLDRQIAGANQLLATGTDPAEGIDVRVLAPLSAARTRSLDKIAAAIGVSEGKRRHLEALATCTVSDPPAAPSGAPAGNPTTAPAGASPAPSPSASQLPDPQGANLELPNNTGAIVRPTSVRIEYRGNAVSKVVPMPRFLRELTGDAKPTSRGPANARATWTCSGFTDRLSDKYPICPRGSLVTRVQDFPGCWDGKNIDSANHRSHVAFADRTTGACPAWFVAIPQLRITIAYDIPRDAQLRGQYALDSFPEENHNPFSDHNDFINVNSDAQMNAIQACINDGKRCR